MSPQEFVTATRRKYNSVGSTFYADAEVLDLLYQVEMELATFALTIEATDTSTSTVVGTRSYSLPTRAIAIKRLTYDDQKLKKISFREDDALTLWDEGTSTTGTPYFYELFADSIYLRPVPDAVKTLKFYYFKEPAVITIAETIESPTRYHMAMTDGVVSEMMYKDENPVMGDRYRRKFEEAKKEAKEWQRKRQNRDSLTYVLDEDGLNQSVLGLV